MAGAHSEVLEAYHKLGRTHPASGGVRPEIGEACPVVDGAYLVVGGTCPEAFPGVDEAYFEMDG